MTDYLFDTPKVQSIPVKGEAAEYPVHRIFCVGRNYAAHAAEMGVEVDREAPFYFTKSPQAVLASGSTLTYPPGTSNLHYEMELVMVIGKPAFRVSVDDAAEAIYAYGCGLDMTRRDLQQAGKDKRRPWDLGKDVEGSAVLSPLTTAGKVGQIGPQRIHLEVNGEIKQDARLSDMIHGVAEVIADLSKFYHLAPGDVIMTGTPAGVGPVVAGDKITGGIDGLDPIALTIGAPE
ncbi:fumarylacetoacetate hydrolase family protein [Nioella nitratireducens]|uniref:fumarylacetoacetate hydrolase family protein n=1 Tax=Nioella nitratireducens TaxID=1287720 RepID=UPI0008FD4B43|nr:fumarylacetoacetate hydrolase family protein [Nioella nitratireducens]